MGLRSTVVLWLLILCETSASRIGKLLGDKEHEVLLSKYFSPPHDHSFQINLRGHKDLLLRKGFSPTHDDSFLEDLDLYGYWSGQVGQMRLLFRISKDDLGSHVHLYSLDQGGDLISASDYTMNAKDDTVGFVFSTIRGAFVANVDADAKTMDGTWIQAGNSLPLTMSRFVPSKGNPVPREFRFLLDAAVSTADPDVLRGGYWLGQFREVSIVLHLDQVEKNMIEPKVYGLSVPVGVRSFVVQADKSIKIVVDNFLVQEKVMLLGHLGESGKAISGTVCFDDHDDADTMTLFWSEHYPS